MVHRADKRGLSVRDPGRAGGCGAAGGRARAWPTAGGPDPGQPDPPSQGTAARLEGRSEIRVLFAFDPTRSALLLLGGDKTGNWQRWYRQNIPLAEQLYLDYTTRATEGEE